MLLTIKLKFYLQNKLWEVFLSIELILRPFKIVLIFVFFFKNFCMIFDFLVFWEGSY